MHSTAITASMFSFGNFFFTKKNDITFDLTKIDRKKSYGRHEVFLAHPMLPVQNVKIKFIKFVIFPKSIDFVKRKHIYF